MFRHASPAWGHEGLNRVLLGFEKPSQGLLRLRKFEGARGLGISVAGAASKIVGGQAGSPNEPSDSCFREAI